MKRVLRLPAVVVAILSMAGCSCTNGQNGPDPAGPGDGGFRLGPSTSECFVSERGLVLDIAIPIVFVRQGKEVVEPVRWSLRCALEGCDGTGQWSPSLGPAGEIESFSLTSARLVSLSGLTAVVEWQGNTLVVDAGQGVVNHTGGVLDMERGHGTARCDRHGAPIPVEPSKTT